MSMQAKGSHHRRRGSATSTSLIVPPPARSDPLAPRRPAHRAENEHVVQRERARRAGVALGLLLLAQAQQAGKALAALLRGLDKRIELRGGSGAVNANVAGIEIALTLPLRQPSHTSPAPPAQRACGRAGRCGRGCGCGCVYAPAVERVEPGHVRHPYRAANLAGVRHGARRSGIESRTQATMELRRSPVGGRTSPRGSVRQPELLLAARGRDPHRAEEGVGGWGRGPNLA
eukprot:363986-Chlamydomonas_euryale.AAC.10